MSHLISIILPTYNVADYLEECLASLSKQTYGNIEIIVVIDGATDGSYEIAKDYCLKDKRVQIIYQENAGSGSARNNGIDNAKGEFITFVDPDDWVQPGYIEKLVSIQSRGDYDLVLTGFESHVFIDGKDKKKGITTFKEDRLINNQREAREHYVELRCNIRLDNAPWAKLFKTSVLRGYNVRFPDLRRSQDIYFNANYYNYISSLAESQYVGYCYRIIQGQRAKKINNEYYKTSEILFNQLISMLGSWGISYDKQLVYNMFLLNIIVGLESNIVCNASSEDLVKNEFVKIILNNSNPHNWYHKWMKYCIIYRYWTIASLLLRIKGLIKS